MSGRGDVTQEPVVSKAQAEPKVAPQRPPSARAAAAAIQSQGGYAVQAAGNYGLSNGPSAPRDTAFIENSTQRRAFVNDVRVSSSNHTALSLSGLQRFVGSICVSAAVAIEYI